MTKLRAAGVSSGKRASRISNGAGSITHYVMEARSWTIWNVEVLRCAETYPSDLTISSVIFLASENSIIVLSRKKSSFSIPA